MEDQKSTTGQHQPRLNILPILIIAGLLYVLFMVDINSLINSPQFQKNLLYIKTSMRSFMPPLPNINISNLSNSFKMPKIPELGIPTNYTDTTSNIETTSSTETTRSTSTTSNTEDQRGQERFDPIIETRSETQLDRSN